MFVLLDANWFPLHPSNWRQAGEPVTYWSFTEVGGSSEVVEQLSTDIMTVYWRRSASHSDGASLDMGSAHCCGRGMLDEGALERLVPLVRRFLSPNLDVHDHQQHPARSSVRRARWRPTVSVVFGAEAWSRSNGWRCHLAPSPRANVLFTTLFVICLPSLFAA